MKLKKIIAVSTILAMTLSFVGCSNSAAPQPSTEAGSQAAGGTEAAADLYDISNYKSSKDKSEWTIAVITKDSTADWFKRMGTGVDEFGNETGINVIQKGPANADAASQVQVVDDMINQGVDAICVVPIDPGALEASLKRAMEQGIVVITHEASNQVHTLFDTEAFTAEDYGSAIMDSLAGSMNEEGKYALMVAYTTTTTHMEYSKAEYEHQLAKYPNMELINDGKIPTAEYEESINLAYERAKELLKANPDLKGFAGVVNEGVAKAIEELGMDATMVGVGTPNQFKPYVESGTVSAVVLWDPKVSGYVMCQVASMILEGKDITDGMDLGVDGYNNVSLVEGDNRCIVGNANLIVTIDNINDFDF